MDLQAHTLIGTASPNWVKRLAFVCFALACGLLYSSLTSASKTGTAVPPSASITATHLV